MSYRIYDPDEHGPHHESLQALEDEHWRARDAALQDSGECPFGHRDGVVRVSDAADAPLDGDGSWWCRLHRVRFGRLT